MRRAMEQVPNRPILTQNIWNGPASGLECVWRGALIASVRPRLIAARRFRWEPIMQDFLWLLVAVGLLAATLAYVRLCDHA